MWRHRSAVALVIVAVLTGRAQAQTRTDVITMANGDRITGEVSRLDRGRLEFKTDDEGTIYVEWDKIVSLQSRRSFEVVTGDGRRFLGSFGTGDRRSVVVIGPTESVSLTTAEVTVITPIGRSFWKKLDGSIDVGFSYTHSSDVAQLNVNTSTVFRKPAFEARVAGSATLTGSEEEDSERSDRASLQASYLHYRGQRLFVSAAAGVETNESLGLRLRSQLGGAVGTRLVDTNRAQLSVGTGLSVNDERGVDTEPTQNLEALFVFRSSYFSYDNPRTNLDVSLQYFPSLSDFGRQRVQLDSSIRRELWKDVFLAFNVFDTFDSRPPGSNANRNDVGVVLSFGLSY